MRSSRAGLKATSSPKICSSGMNRNCVLRFFDGATWARGARGLPREKLWLHSNPSRQTVMSSRADRALTTDTPTPCRPPEVS